MGAHRLQETGGEFLPLHHRRVEAMAVIWRHRDDLQVMSLVNPDSSERELVVQCYGAIHTHAPELTAWNGCGFDWSVLPCRALVHRIQATLLLGNGEERRGLSLPLLPEPIALAAFGPYGHALGLAGPFRRRPAGRCHPAGVSGQAGFWRRSGRRNLVERRSERQAGVLRNPRHDHLPCLAALAVHAGPTGCSRSHGRVGSGAGLSGGPSPPHGYKAQPPQRAAMSTAP